MTGEPEPAKVWLDDGTALDSIADVFRERNLSAADVYDDVLRIVISTGRHVD